MIIEVVEFLSEVILSLQISGTYELSDTTNH